MGSVVFIAMGMSFLAVLIWYIDNEKNGSLGDDGLFALRPAEIEPADQARSYRSAGRASYAWRYDPMARMREEAAASSTFSSRGRGSNRFSDMGGRRYTEQKRAQAFKQK